MLLGIILTSLEDHSHVSSLLGYSYSTVSEDRLGSQDLHLAEVLMKTLLQNLSFHTVRTYPLSLVSTTQELLDRKVAAPV
jgi:E3 ubiquitin-protein ligase HERC1